MTQIYCALILPSITYETRAIPYVTCILFTQKKEASTSIDLEASDFIRNYESTTMVIQ